MNVLEIVVGVILVAGIITGMIRGSLKVIVSILTSVLIIVVSSFAAPYVVTLVDKYTPLGEMVQSKTEKQMIEAAESSYKQEIQESALTYDAVEKVFDAAGIEDEDLEEFGISIADIVQGNVTMDELTEYGISSNLLMGIYRVAEGNAEKFDPVKWAEGLSKTKQYAVIEETDFVPVIKSLLNENNNKTVYEQLGAENFLDYISLFMARLYVHLAAFFLVFMLAGIVIRAIIFALDIVTGLPSKGFLNRLFGGVLGIADMIIAIWILFCLLNIFYSTEIGRKIFEMMNEQPYIKMLYSLNPVWDFISKIL
ncbi:MAG: CvpA family protein [Dorea sp.]|nr:CvpA family protein [Dorea sp.]